MPQERKTVTLPDGKTTVTLRRLSEFDRRELEAGEDQWERAKLALKLAVVSPPVELEGLPAAEPEADGPLHYRDLDADDLTMLLEEIARWSLGGDQRARFPGASTGAGHA